MRDRTLRSTLQSLRIGVWLIVILARSAAAQSIPDTTMTASLLKRLGEAVDGSRTGAPVWVVAAWRFPHRVLGVFANREVAAAATRRLAGYGLFGPYIAPPDSGVSTLMYTMDPCPGRHDPYSNCPDSLWSGYSLALPQSAIDSITINLFSEGAIAAHRSFTPDQLDAVFFTLPAIDKFAIPYYERLYGAAYAARMRADYLRAIAAARRR